MPMLFVVWLLENVYLAEDFRLITRKEKEKNHVCLFNVPTWGLFLELTYLP